MSVTEKIFIDVINRITGLEKLKAQQNVLRKVNKTTTGLSKTYSQYNQIGNKANNVVKRTTTASVGLDGIVKRNIKTQDVSNKVYAQKERMFRNLDKQVVQSEALQRKAQLGVEKAMYKSAKSREIVGRKTEALANKNKFLSDWSGKLGVNTARVSQAMGAAGLKIDETGEVVNLAGQRVDNLAHVMKKGEIQTRIFNMSLLSVMFAGMALKKSMGGLLKPAAEATGLFDVMSDILVDTFEPILEAITPLFEWFAEVMDKLGNTTKIIIGGIVLFLFVGGAMLALGGQLGLAYGGLSVQMATLTLALQSATVSFAGMGTSAVVAGTSAQVAFAPFLPIMYAILAIGALVALLFYKWEDILDSLGDTFKWFGATVRMVITSMVLFFGWLSDKITTFYDSIFEIFTTIGNFLREIWEGITNWLSDTWDNIKQYFVDKWNGMIEWFKGLWQGLSDWFWGILSKIGNFFKNIWQGIKDFFGPILSAMWQTIVSVWDTISTWFFTLLTNIGTWFKEKWTSIKTWFSEHLTSVYNFFKNIWTSIKNTASDIWNGITGVIKGAINIIIGLINKLTDAWNSLSFTVPKIKIPFRGTFGGGTYGVTQIPNIPLLQEGGIIRKPTLAMIGERGAEAVVPLNKGYGETVINFSPVYNITVSDKYEFEKMIKFNNTKIVEDLRRLVKD